MGGILEQAAQVEKNSENAQGVIASPKPLVGAPGDGLWLWLPLPLLALFAWVLGQFSPQFGADLALKCLLLINFMHLGATWTRLYGDARRDHPIAAYLLPLLLLAFSIACMAAQKENLLFFCVFLANIPHIGLQNYGFIQIIAQQNQAASKVDRILDKAYQGLIPLALAIYFALYKGADLFNSQSLGLDRIPPALLGTFAALALILTLALFLRMAQLRADGRPVPRERWILHLLYGPGMLLCFWLLPANLAPLPIAGTHYIQYLVVVRRFHHRRAAQRGERGIWSRVHPMVYLLLLALLAPGIPVVVDTALEPLLGHLIPAIGAAASLHHFLADGLIWRLRDSKTRKTMLA